MLTRTNILWVIVTIAVLVASLAMLGTAVAQRQAVPKPQDKLALGENEVKQLLLLMDSDQSGKISKQEWMKFLEAEFDRPGQGQERPVGRQGTNAVEIACKPPCKCG